MRPRHLICSTPYIFNFLNFFFGGGGAFGFTDFAGVGKSQGAQMVSLILRVSGKVVVIFVPYCGGICVWVCPQPGMHSFTL